MLPLEKGEVVPSWDQGSRGRKDQSAGRGRWKREGCRIQRGPKKVQGWEGAKQRRGQAPE